MGLSILFFSKSSRGISAPKREKGKRKTQDVRKEREGDKRRDKREKTERKMYPKNAHKSFLLETEQRR